MMLNFRFLLLLQFPAQVSESVVISVLRCSNSAIEAAIAVAILICTCIVLLFCCVVVRLLLLILLMIVVVVVAVVASMGFIRT